MPTYEYRCSNCGHQLEAVQSFSEAALTQCPACGRPDLRKLFGNVGVVFKGSGFYRNDSRNETKNKPAGTPSKKADSGDSGSGDAGSGKPAAADSSSSDSSGGSSSTQSGKPGKPGKSGSASAASGGSGGAGGSGGSSSSG